MIKNLKIWKTIELINSNSRDLLGALAKIECDCRGPLSDFLTLLCPNIDEANKTIQKTWSYSVYMEHFLKLKQFNQDNKVVLKNLCMMTVEQIIGQRGTHIELLESIGKIGGLPVEVEAGPQLRLQYQDQPVHDQVSILVKKDKDLFQCPDLFRLENWGHMVLLRTTYVNDDYLWPGHEKIIFGMT
ncbi:MAG: hypothetical protein US83_C0004G0078 [Candidatus Falkowbacteria bacterium GW2011_GWC2_38_22]|uniref:Uncharacterized protein n=1 Tax=Candidatus Falkowbacteria bacterium GW2011_GWE1_38_31 TaxID=1618638 RepID=A0A0G0MA22_9BACT|nr:MAG: hypothetical protein US73_C0002G0039 [Candidatus Falkowbacteria bacterium GW2011_GWF2_38_1205]KKQ61694.1 MAG: hypothetical protein US83_C0004G0078 [Candidatus Falkowbacteria bacterium GW2011_GWC2_38_22]KKQ63691.1 MAG: hypothetical protein US84_C0004G0039 [Candidatus Falkowbacteria bacterium GW2011_GWF1_38_22]KKQ65893.1 MAG: hypothetical protein US87_C0004G0078 [Candidatus Falkowbacteria bacterium GW2011_GWE2_38_254]KKQ70554.1 MAG: hypothetical protein US91_C0004G0039 [Candidatus Falkowb